MRTREAGFPGNNARDTSTGWCRATRETRAVGTQGWRAPTERLAGRFI